MSNMTAAETLWNVRDVAARLRLSTRSIYKLAASGRLPRPVKVGGATRWRESDLAAFLAAGCDMRAYDIGAGVNGGAVR